MFFFKNKINQRQNSKKTFYFNIKRVIRYFLILIVLLYFYVAEHGLKLIGYGIVRFSNSLWNIFDFLMLILYALYFALPEFMPFDNSPVRLIKLLLFMGVFVKPLKVFYIFKLI